MPKLESEADTSYMLQLPKVSFRVIDDGQASISQTGVKSEQCRSYGFNDFSEFERPEHYIRYIEPIESELAVQVEYDMDEQDQEWLDSVNAERQKEQSGPISYEVFEIVMDKLEKEWFTLIKRIPQPASHLPVEDSRCSICDDGEGENSNAIVFCDGCNLAVHQDCYGVPYIPEGQWLCRKCTVSPENPVSCIFCPNEGGAFKKTTTGHWAHLLCAIWIPELTVGNSIYMEPVQDVELLPKSRWKLVCSLCHERVGACIQCENKQCFTAFHVTCARQAGQLMTMKTLGTEGVLKAYCDKHLPPDMRHALDSESESEFEDAPKFNKQSRRHSGTRKTAVTTKTARAHAKAYRPGPPIVPRLIVNSLLEYVAKVAMRKKQPFVERLCRYWSLKREARRGAPLLKRLHLEPWTASSTSKDQSEEEKAVKLKFLTMLRNDLDKVRMLAELTRKREKEKLKQAQVIKDIVDSFIFPAYGKLRLTLQKISAMDRQDLFLHFVSRVEVPDYYEVIKEPMCWTLIDEKIEQNEYRRVADFKHDIDLVLDNAMKYNAPDSTFHRIAKRIQGSSRELLAELDQLATPAPLKDSINGDANHEHGEIGDLEPSRHFLEVLISQSGDSQQRDRLASLFAFDLEPLKEPTPPPSPTPVPVKKRENYADRKRKWEEKEARHLERLESGRSTRAGQAKEEAFQHEAGLLSPLPAAPQSEAGPSTRWTRHSMGNTSSEASKTLGSSSSTSASRPVRSQVGVAGREIVERLSDKERRAREQELNLEIEAVDNSDQFTRFNTGWILPEGSSRRKHNDSPAIPLKPRVRKPKAVPEEVEALPSSLPELEPPSSPLSAITAPESPLSPVSSDMPSPVRPYPRRGIPAPSPLHQSTSRASPSSTKPSRKRRISADTPDTARPSKVARPAPTSRQSRQSAKMEVDAFLAGEDETAVEGLIEGFDSEDLTPVPGEEVGQVGSMAIPPESKSAGRGEATPATASGAEVVQGEDAEGSAEEERFTPGTLVWAKQQGYPYFPAEVVDAEEEQDQLSPSVFKEEARVRASAKGSKIYLVNFFDKHNTYGWIPENKLDMLGEDDEIDQMYLALKEKGRSKSGKSKQGPLVKEGYRQALAGMALDGEE